MANKKKRVDMLVSDWSKPAPRTEEQRAADEKDIISRINDPEWNAEDEWRYMGENKLWTSRATDRYLNTTTCNSLSSGFGWVYMSANTIRLREDVREHLDLLPKEKYEQMQKNSVGRFNLTPDIIAKLDADTQAALARFYDAQIADVQNRMRHVADNLAPGKHASSVLFSSNKTKQQIIHCDYPINKLEEFGYVDPRQPNEPPGVLALISCLNEGSVLRVCPYSQKQQDLKPVLAEKKRKKRDEDEEDADVVNDFVTKMTYPPPWYVCKATSRHTPLTTFYLC